MQYSHPAIAQQLEVLDNGYSIWLANGVATPATPTDVLLFEILNEIQALKVRIGAWELLKESTTDGEPSTSEPAAEDTNTKA